MRDRPIHVLLLCTGNSARSILGEALVNALGVGRFVAFSAGSHPTGTVNPAAIAALRQAGHAVDGLESKSWDRFAAPDAPEMDIVITVCDTAAGESCPVWPGSPVAVNWGIPDPAAADEAQRAEAFARAYARLAARIQAMVELPLEDFDPRMQRESLQRIHDAMAAST